MEITRHEFVKDSLATLGFLALPGGRFAAPAGWKRTIGVRPCSSLGTKGKSISTMKMAGLAPLRQCLSGWTTFIVFPLPRNGAGMEIVKMGAASNLCRGAVSTTMSGALANIKQKTG